MTMPTFEPGPPRTTPLNPSAPPRRVLYALNGKVC
jgi:hypothetical protein